MRYWLAIGSEHIGLGEREERGRPENGLPIWRRCNGSVYQPISYSKQAEEVIGGERVEQLRVKTLQRGTFWVGTFVSSEREARECLTVKHFEGLIRVWERTSRPVQWNHYTQAHTAHSNSFSRTRRRSAPGAKGKTQSESAGMCVQTAAPLSLNRMRQKKWQKWNCLPSSSTTWANSDKPIVQRCKEELPPFRRVVDWEIRYRSANAKAIWLASSEKWLSGRLRVKRRTSSLYCYPLSPVMNWIRSQMKEYFQV